MNSLKSKLKKEGGFTLVELLIVVAIIAVLVAVSIPMMNSALEKSRHAVDQANVRNAIALASMEYLTDSTVDFKDAQVYTYYVDANNQGILVGASESAPAGAEPAKPQCECTAGTGVTKGTGDLKVSIQAPDAGADAPTILVSWRFDKDTNMTVAGDTIS